MAASKALALSAEELTALGTTVAEAMEGEDSEAASLREALGRVDDPAALALAVLFHDLGKGQGGGHVVRGARIATRIAQRIGLPDAVASDVVFLVAKHLVMSQVSQRRDLTDPVVLDGFAETVGAVDRLNMLYVLTYVDVNGVGPGVWNRWKASLLQELYAKALARIRGGAATGGEPEERIVLEEKVVEALHPEFLRRDVDEFLTHLPDRYMRSIPTDAIARHFEMTRELAGKSVVIDWRPSGRSPYTVLSVCVRDAPGVLARLAGALTGQGLDILSVDVFTRDDGIALDVFRVSESLGSAAVQAVEEKRFRAIEKEIEAALEGRADLDGAVERQRTRPKTPEEDLDPSRRPVRGRRRGGEDGSGGSCG